MTKQTRYRQSLPLAVIGSGSVAHRVDDYRYSPGRTVCGRGVADHQRVGQGSSLPLCTVCANRDYPTEAEFHEYMACTDCGTDTWSLGEDFYQVRYRVWEEAYPGYSDGVGVGSSRPCIGCLERRLGRALTAGDFTAGQARQPYFSSRLNDRLGGER